MLKSLHANEVDKFIIQTQKEAIFFRYCMFNNI